MTKHFLYTLKFESVQGDVVFYVGHTNDPRRRETEHKSAAKNTDNQEYKYQTCRMLDKAEVRWYFEVVGEIDNDEDTEYEWVLKYARVNQDMGMTFIDDLPLTNMRRGDFLEEILADKTISTASDIKQYRQDRKNRVSSYMGSGIGANSSRVITKLNDEVEANRIQRHEQRLKAIQREQNYQAMITDPERQNRIREQTLALEAEIRLNAIGHISELVTVKNNGAFPRDIPDKLVKR